MFDALVRAPTGLVYAFRGDIYWEYDGENGGVQMTSPRLMNTPWQGIPPNLDAAFRGRGSRRNKLYFFKGQRYWRYSWNPGTDGNGVFRFGKVDAGYPKAIKGAFQDLWSDGIDAVVDFRDHLRYTLRRNRIRRSDINNDTLKKEITPISDEFDNVPADICAAVAGEDTLRARQLRNHIYFFKQDRGVIPTGWPTNLTHKTWVYDHDTQRHNQVARFRLSTVNKWKNVANVVTTSRLSAVKNFATDTRPSKFPMLNRAKIAEQLEARLTDPRYVQQDSIGFCGPASIVYWLVKTQPDAYIRIVNQLYHLGKFNTHGDTFAPSQTFMNSSPELANIGSSQIEEIDWMVMGAMRDASGIMELDGNGDDITGTNARIMKKWCREILGYRDVGRENTVVLGEHKALDLAVKAYNSENAIDSGAKVQGIGILAIHSRLLQDAVKKNKKTSKDDSLIRALGHNMVGNHWVVYEGDNWSSPGRRLLPNDGHFSFDVYSWGKIFRVDVSEREFRNNVFGVVWGK